MFIIRNTSKLLIIVTMTFIFVFVSGCEPSSNGGGANAWSPSSNGVVTPPLPTPPVNDRWVGVDRGGRPHFVDKQGREYVVEMCFSCQGSGVCENCRKQRNIIDCTQDQKKDLKKVITEIESDEDAMELLDIRQEVRQWREELIECDHTIWCAEREIRFCPCKGTNICPTCRGFKEYKVYL